jgi:hypothetical protein
MLAVLQSLAGRKPTPPTLRYLRYWTNQLVTCITQDVPTYFRAVQRSRLLMIVMPLHRGFSDTNQGEANQLYYKMFVRFLHILLPLYETLSRTPTALVGELSSCFTRIHPTLRLVRCGTSAVLVKPELLILLLGLSAAHKQHAFLNL